MGVQREVQIKGTSKLQGHDTVTLYEDGSMLVKAYDGRLMPIASTSELKRWVGEILELAGDSDPRLWRGCSVPGCSGRHSGLGFCSKHYQRLRRWGDPLAVKRNQYTPVTREEE